MPAELKNCPLCGGEAYDKGYGIECLECGLWLGDGTMITGTYIEQWNRRAEIADKIANGPTTAAAQNAVKQ